MKGESVVQGEITVEFYPCLADHLNNYAVRSVNGSQERAATSKCSTSDSRAIKALILLHITFSTPFMSDAFMSCPLRS
jgi:hypothetical protein